MSAVGFIGDLHGRSGRSMLPPAPAALSGPGPAVAAGAVFLPRQKDAAACAKRLLVTSLASHGLVVDAWREVRAADDVLSDKARGCPPNIFDVVVTRHSHMNAEEFERRLGAARKETEQRAAAYHLEDFYIASLSLVT
ncbi:MAG: hypothetical protein ACXVIJ_11395 [Thermoanaerobaculia bacterium]